MNFSYYSYVIRVRPVDAVTIRFPILEYPIPLILGGKIDRLPRRVSDLAKPSCSIFECKQNMRKREKTKEIQKGVHVSTRVHLRGKPCRNTFWDQLISFVSNFPSSCWLLYCTFRIFWMLWMKCQPILAKKGRYNTLSFFIF